MSTRGQFFVDGDSLWVALRLARSADIPAGPAKPAAIYEIEAVQMDPGGAWLQIFNRAGAPPAGTVPLLSYPMLQGQLFNKHFASQNEDQGRVFGLGCVVAWSSTPEHYTGMGASGPIVISGRALTA